MDIFSDPTIVKKAKTCWLCLLKPDMHGVRKWKSRSVRVLSWLQFKGASSPPRIRVTCGHEDCVNPEHLTEVWPALTAEQKFWKCVNKTEDCWLWTGTISYGQGVFSSRRRAIKARPFSWKLHRGAYPGKIFSHCGNRLCVNPDHLSMQPGSQKQWIERFWSKVRKGVSCWEWTGALLSAGYGNCRWAGRRERSHRVSWFIHRGHIPKGRLVLHRCDNRKCVRPDHLFLGDNKVNLGDMAAKRRSAHGERNGHCKLSARQVLEILELRAAGHTYIEIASKMPVGASHIGSICRRKAWPYVREYDYEKTKEKTFVQRVHPPLHDVGFDG